MNIAHEPPSTPRLVEAHIDRAEVLDIFPDVALEVRTVVDDATTSLLELEEVVARDPVLAAQVLKVANSPFFGLSRDVGSVRQAILVLGFRATRDLSFALAMASAGRTGGSEGLALWRHSLRVGIAARWIGRGLRGVEGADAFVVGMLHDLGRLVFLVTDPEPYRTLMATAASQRWGEVQLQAAERRTYGFDHARLSAACLARWNLPDATVQAVRYHHEPLELLEVSAQAFRLAVAVHLAEAFVGHVDGGRSPDVASAHVLQSDLARGLGLHRSDLTGLVRHFEDEVDAWV